jgi:hypothetical protein
MAHTMAVHFHCHSRQQIYQNEYCIKHRVIEKATGFRNLKVLDNFKQNVEAYS